MIKHDSGITVITCDKCRSECVATSDTYNDVFYHYGWVLNKGRKYEHLCGSCFSKTPRGRRMKSRNFPYNVMNK